MLMASSCVWVELNLILNAFRHVKINIQHSKMFMVKDLLYIT